MKRGFVLWDDIMIWGNLVNEVSRIVSLSLERSGPAIYGCKSKNNMKRAFLRTLFFNPDEAHEVDVDGK